MSALAMYDVYMCEVTLCCKAKETTTASPVQSLKENGLLKKNNHRL